jgi:general secretion pathway protein I
MKRSLGFTLIEVLVALGIVAIALVAGAQATAALTANAQRQSDVLLAHICAEDEMVRMRLAKQMPSVGDAQVDCEQAGELYTVRIKVAPTPNPSFRRIDAQVFAAGAPVLRLSTVLGRY